MNDDLLDRLVLLTHGLQAAGIPAGLSETVDAAEALGVIDLLDRSSVRTALRATLVKQRDDYGAFALLFDRYFALTRAVADRDQSSLDRQEPAGAGNPADDGGGGQPSDLLAEFLDAVLAGDSARLRRLASSLVDAHAGMEAQLLGERYHLNRVLRAVDLSRLLADATRQLRTNADHTDSLAARVTASEQSHLMDDFRRFLADDIRSRLAAAGDVTEIIRSTRIDELEVLRASTTNLRALREAVRPLARTLASRMAQCRRLKQRGKLDVRRTMRRSLQVGGVPMQPAFKDRHASKPDVVVLCDVSESVAEFANFTLQMLTALHSEMHRLRSFVFVDGIAEVTELIETSEFAIDPRFLISRPGVVVADGHSDYACVFKTFHDRHLDAIRPSTNIIIAGDARTNHRPSGEETLRVIAGRAKRVLWFNPEPSEVWNSCDSQLSAYRPHCTNVFEIRTLRQLADAVATLV